MVTYGLTAAGFVAKDLQTIKTELETDFKALFGQDQDVSAQSVNGQDIGNRAAKWAQAWEMLQAIYASFNPDSAEGIAQDGGAALVCQTRLPATHTIVPVMVYGTVGTLILIEHKVSQIIGIVFKSAQSTTISMSLVGDCKISVTSNPTVGQVFTITINTIAYSYTASGGDSKLVVLTALRNAINAASLGITAVLSDSNSELRLYSDDGETGFSLDISALLQRDLLGTPSIYLAQDTGEISAPSNSVNNIIDVVSGLDSVNNLVAGITGRDIESNNAFRIRRRKSLASIGYASDAAIANRILMEVPDVLYCRVFSNRTMSVDSEGRPAKSFEAVVEGGLNAAIAAKIWQVEPSGIQPWGTTHIIIQDSTGNPQDIYFTRPGKKYIWAQITITESTEEAFPVNGHDVIKDNIVAWAAQYMSVGFDVYWQRLFIPTYKCPGIASATLVIGVSDDPLTPPSSYAAANIVISSHDAAMFDQARISVS